MKKIKNRNNENNQNNQWWVNFGIKIVSELFIQIIKYFFNNN